MYGHRLDVTLHLVLARAFVAEQWKNVMQRAQVERFAPILSLDSVCRALLERSDTRRVVWDLGDDFISGGVLERGALRDYQVFKTADLGNDGIPARIEEISGEWITRYGVTEPIVLSGDRAEMTTLAPAFVVGSPKRVPGIESPADAALGGLLEAASQRERRVAYIRSREQWAKQAREKANAFIQDYF